MAQCLIADSAASGAVRATDTDPCTTLLALTPAEFASISASPLNITAEDGALLSAAILSVWATAWAFRALARILYMDGEVTEE